jgi:hypothetical protein
VIALLIQNMNCLHRSCLTIVDRDRKVSFFSELTAVNLSRLRMGMKIDINIDIKIENGNENRNVNRNGNGK